MDTHAIEVRFLTAIQTLATASQSPRAITKALADLPESAAASEAVQGAVLDGMSMDRLRTIVKASQGDSRRGRGVASRLLEWMELGRPAKEGRPIEKAATHVLPALATIPDGFLKWQQGTDAYAQGVLEAPKGFEASQATDIPRKEEPHALPKGGVPLAGTDEPRKRKVNPKSDLVD